ncbi:sporulation membrane protein YtaF [Petroclostridium sp. X23]|uniref:sporulation membrane protein YtaF n=1 Tax=Petroclostridium sp. X23 TaxID=3045146 RepID=UPI0024ACCEA2|nr:sporulation membrane protein YtaF [Petroclostridium sp. X23]WHH57708.1 sporulation membrane protein YtaF [Petroclostridium sp. X23]
MTALLLALSLSLDSFGIGISYGIKKIKVAKTALLIITMMSLGALSCSWLLGQAILSIVSIHTTKILSALLLMSLGIFVFIQAFFDALFPASEEEKLIKKIKIKPLSIVVNIIREPSSSDIDHSGVIDIREAVYIGAALSIDSISVGIAAAAFQINLASIVIFTAVLNIILLKIGELIGKKFGNLVSQDKLKFASGTIIFILGILKLI